MWAEAAPAPSGLRKIKVLAMNYGVAVQGSRFFKKSGAKNFRSFGTEALKQARPSL